MGFEDREYYRDGPRTPGTGLAKVGRWLLYGRVFLFRAFGINVHAHSSLILAIVFTLLFMSGGYTWQDRLIAAGMLFLIVLLHEFGHCFGARWVGGDAEEIVMHPLGGLAFAKAPPIWHAQFITVAAGPAVNVVLCIVFGIALYFLGDGQLPWQPFYAKPWYAQSGIGGWSDPAWWCYWIFQSNLFLLLFNLMPIFPLDGGQMVQSLLWPKFGYYRSMYFAATTGLVAAIIGGAYGLASGKTVLVILAVMGVMHCLSIRRQLKEAGPYAFGEYDDPFTSVMYRSQRENRRANRGPTRAQQKQAKRIEKDRAAEEAEIDRILAKVSANGMHSLTRSEQKVLKRATERQQQREAGR